MRIARTFPSWNNNPRLAESKRNTQRFIRGLNRIVAVLVSKNGNTMRSIPVVVLLAAMGFASAAQGALAPGAEIGVVDEFSISGIKVDARAQSPREARDLAMTRGSALAWSKLFRRITNQSDSETEPRLGERELMGLILRADVENERRNTTRYVADVTFHFNPAAVRRVLSRSNTAAIDRFGSINRQTGDSNTYLAINVRFDAAADWAILRARLNAVDSVTGMEIVGRTAEDAQIYLSYSGEVEQLQSTLAQHALQLSSSEGEYTLRLSPVSATTASLRR